MRKVTFVKDYKEFKSGDMTYVGNNEAHSLIELGVAALFIQEYEDKMMKRKGKKWR
jgi:mannose-6-phosphate isomerase-like protein (cupin superfamily)